MKKIPIPFSKAVVVLFTFSILFISKPSVCLADHHEPDHTPEDTSADAPFDSGLTILIAAAVGYEAKRRYNKRQKAKEKEQV